MNHYLDLDDVIAIGGSWIVDSSFVIAKDWSGLAKRANEVRNVVKNKIRQIFIICTLLIQLLNSYMRKQGVLYEASCYIWRNNGTLAHPKTFAYDKHA